MSSLICYYSSVHGGIRTRATDVPLASPVLFLHAPMDHRHACETETTLNPSIACNPEQGGTPSYYIPQSYGTSAVRTGQCNVPRPDGPDGLDWRCRSCTARCRTARVRSFGLLLPHMPTTSPDLRGLSASI